MRKLRLTLAEQTAGRLEPVRQNADLVRRRLHRLDRLPLSQPVRVRRQSPNPPDDAGREEGRRQETSDETDPHRHDDRDLGS